MSQAAEAHDSWADQPDPMPKRRRREPDSWASADDLEMMSNIGRPRSADWTVLTLERDDDDLLPYSDEEIAMAAPRAVRPGAERRTAPALRIVTDDDRAFTATDDPFADDDRTFAEPPAPGMRRTVVIRGRGDERQNALPATNERRRPARRPSERVGHRPDRVAMWAVGLGLLLILVALLSAGGS